MPISTRSHEDWQQAKLKASAFGRMAVRVLELDDPNTGSMSGLAGRHFTGSIPGDLRKKRLWDIRYQVWVGPWNLSAPGELAYYLAKRDEQGNPVYALEPPRASAEIEAPSPEQGNADKHDLEMKFQELERQNAELLATIRLLMSSASGERKGAQEAEHGSS